MFGRFLEHLFGAAHLLSRDIIGAVNLGRALKLSQSFLQFVVVAELHAIGNVLPGGIGPCSHVGHFIPRVGRLQGSRLLEGFVGHIVLFLRLCPHPFLVGIFRRIGITWCGKR